MTPTIAWVKTKTKTSSTSKAKHGQDGGSGGKSVLQKTIKTGVGAIAKPTSSPIASSASRRSGRGSPAAATTTTPSKQHSRRETAQLAQSLDESLDGVELICRPRAAMLEKVAAEQRAYEKRQSMAQAASSKLDVAIDMLSDMLNGGDDAAKQ
ncbi:hypothetical protein RI367_001664 [Sorochytrium milnesiophthora]